MGMFKLGQGIGKLVNLVYEGYQNRDRDDEIEGPRDSAQHGETMAQTIAQNHHVRLHIINDSGYKLVLDGVAAWAKDNVEYFTEGPNPALGEDNFLYHQLPAVVEPYGARAVCAMAGRPCFNKGSWAAAIAFRCEGHKRGKQLGFAISAMHLIRDNGDGDQTVGCTALEPSDGESYAERVSGGISIVPKAEISNFVHRTRNSAEVELKYGLKAALSFKLPSVNDVEVRLTGGPARIEQPPSLGFTQTFFQSSASN